MKADTQTNSTSVPPILAGEIIATAAIAAKETLLWIGKLLVLLSGMVAISICIILLTPTYFGVVASILLVTGIVVTIPHHGYERLPPAS
jgi:hypothetical protein